MKRISVHLTWLVLSLATTTTVFAQTKEPGPRDADRALQLATMSSLLVTASLGTIAAINQPTWFSDGRCATGGPIFGEYGCHGFSMLHGFAALVSIVLYTATMTLEFTAFDWPGRDKHGSGYEALSYVTLVGMALQPIGGFLAAVPQVIGLKRDSGFSRALRSLHLMTGWLIVGSFVVTTSIEL